jgi:P-type conjugative transfer protein TrbJ
MAVAARERWRDAMDAWHQSMRVQCQIVEDIRADHGVLADLVNRSQGAVGALQAQQAGNQLLALAAKQQMQLQTLLAAQARAEAQENARKAQAEEAARAATERFLGDGRAYTPR